MLCKVCNKEIADGSKFCMFCGNSQDAQQSAVPEAPVAPEVPVAPIVPAAPVMPEEFRSEQPKPRKRLGLILGLAGGLVAVTLVVVLILTLGGGGSGPWGRISDAMENAFEDGNFTFDMILETQYDEVPIHGMMNVDIEQKDLTLYMETQIDGETAQFVLHDGRFAISEGGYWEYEDMRQDMNMLFFYLQSIQNADQSETMTGEDVQTMLMMMDPEMYSEISEFLDMDRLDTVFEDMGENFCDEKWLATYMGYTTYEQDGETVYRFDIDLFKFVEGILLTMKPAVLDQAMYQEAVEQYQAGAEFLGELEYEFVLELRVDGSYLTGMYYGLEIDGMGGSFDIRFSDPGSTVIPEDMLEQLLDEAERNA